MEMRLVSSDHVELAVTDSRGEGSPVVFVHGFSNDRFVWDDLARALPESFRPICYDLRGHGDSGWSIDSRYHLFDHARDLAELFDALGLERAALAGHSLGGNVATLFAARHPERVRALALVDTGPALGADAWRRASGDLSEQARAYGGVAEYRKLLGLAYPLAAPAALDRLARTSLVQRRDGRFEPKLDPILLELLGTEQLEQNRIELLGTEQQLRETEATLWDALAKLRCPVLLARGERSAMLPEAVALKMAHEVIADARLVQIPNAGHAVMFDNGPALAAELEAFFSALA
jgi:pimeloyl-ACP methyl ester carboxylesterase